MDIQFTNEHTAPRLDELVTFLSGPRLWIPPTHYPDYDEWLHRSYYELVHERKRAMIAIQSNTVIGVVVYQRHKICPDILELKNLTVRPDRRGRYIASFLLRNAEIEGGKEFKTRSIVCDAKAGNLPVTLFLLRHRYRAIARRNLYRWSAGEDTVFYKSRISLPHHLST